MAKKYYVVWKGLKTGVFDNWPAAQKNTAGRADAQFMGFPTKEEAEQAFASTYTKALMKRSMSKSGNTSSATLNKPEKVSLLNNNKSKTQISIYCDGACSPNPGKSGTGVAVYEENILTQLWCGLFEPNGTNNTAELNGMLEAFKLAVPFIKNGKTVNVLSDSKYSIDSITKWAQGWQKKGWKKANGEAIKNPELVKACFELYQQIKTNVVISHVKGHANIEGNELADRMAVIARKKRIDGFEKYLETMDIKTILAMESG